MLLEHIAFYLTKSVVKVVGIGRKVYCEGLDDALVANDPIVVHNRPSVHPILCQKTWYRSPVESGDFPSLECLFLRKDVAAVSLK